MSNVGSILDNPKLARFRKTVTVLSGMGLFLDGFDLTIIAAAGVLIVSAFQLSGPILGLVNASALIGMFLGGMIGGWLTDKLGRKKMYALALVGFVGFAVLTAISWDTWVLVLGRILLGICIGADYAIASVLTSEFGGKGDRGKLVVAMSAMTNSGNVVAYIVAICLVGTGPDAWRWMLLVGAVLAGIVAWLRRSIPESPRWLIRQGRVEEARKIMRDIAGEELDVSEFEDKPVKKLPTRLMFQGVLLKRTIFVWSFWFLFGASYYGVSMFSPQIVKAFAGTDQIFTFVGSGIIAILGVCGALIGSQFVERAGRRTMIIIGYATMFICMGILALIMNFGGGSEIPLIAVIVLVGINILAGQVGPGTLNLLYPNELFPTQLRGQAVGLATAVSRIGSILGVLVFPTLIQVWGTPRALWLFVCLAFCGLLVCIFMAPETKGKSLEEINLEVEQTEVA